MKTVIEYTARCVVLVLLTLGFPALAVGEGTVETAQESGRSQAIPVTRVTLYTAGLAQIVHETTVTGDTILPFEVDQGDVNDILKSLVIEDLDGGTVESVNFDTSNPLSVILSDMRVNPSGSPSLAEFFARTQGEEVSVEVNGFRISGRVFSVESRQEGDVRRTILNLMAVDGLRSVDITQVDAITFEDVSLQNDLIRALELISRSRVSTTRTLRIYLRGEGTRRIRLIYVRAVPLWKTSYRITIGPEGSPRLEAWALVQNTGNAAWSDVNLTFVSGRPNAFTMDLQTPRYVPRQNVDIATAAPLGPTEYDRGYASAEPSISRESLSMAPSAPSMAYDSDDEYGDYGVDSPGFVLQTPTAPTARATGERAGNYYRYEITEPVTVEARSSAMIPILVAEDLGNTVGVYDPSYDLVFKGVRITNSGPAHWSAGPISVLEGRQYAGDALLPEMVPDSTRLITYAVHGSLEVAKTTTSEPQRIIALKISGGLLYRTDRVERTTRYLIQGEEPELVLIHAKTSGWSLVEHPILSEETVSTYRFLVKSWEEPVDVVEEYIISNQYSLVNFRQTEIATYLAWGGISPELKDAFEELGRLRSEVETIAGELSTLSSRLSRLERDQNRVRENMRVLDVESELFAQYEAQLASQEEDIQMLNTQIDETQSKLATAQARVRDFVASLDID